MDKEEKRNKKIDIFKKYAHFKINDFENLKEQKVLWILK